MQQKFPEPIIGIQGAPGTGKTHLAGTLIPEFRTAVQTKKPHTPTLDIPDVCWLQFDRAGSDTLLSYGVRPVIKDMSVPPASLVNIFADEASSTVLGKLRTARLTWLRRVSQILRETAAQAREGVFRLVVVDSMTTLTRNLTDAFIRGELIAEKDDRFDGRGMYKQANLAIGQLIDEMKGIPCPIVWLLHTRAAYTEVTAETLDDASRRPLVHSHEVDVQRGVQGPLESTPSLMLGASLKSDDRGNTSYHLITKPDGRFLIKNRWAARMPNNTVPDLQVVWDVIAAASAESAPKE